MQLFRVREYERPIYWNPNPLIIYQDYSVDYSHIIKEMNWEEDNKNDMELYVIINASYGDPKKMTANLIGPVLINIPKKEAIQMVIQNSLNHLLQECETIFQI